MATSERREATKILTDLFVERLPLRLTEQEKIKIEDICSDFVQTMIEAVAEAQREEEMARSDW